jgi:ribonuclease HI
MSDFIEIYTDGACQGNPGKGGWGAILLCGAHKKEISGYVQHTTNNQMELMAVIESLKIVKKTINIIIHTDSTYVQKGITEWIFNWKKNGWKTAKKQPVKNYELWQELDELAKKHQITWKWVKGHSGNKYNDIADQLAVNAIK